MVWFFIRYYPRKCHAEFISASQNLKVFTQILPHWIKAVYQIYFPVPMPVFQLLFSFYRTSNIIGCFKIDKFGKVIFFL